MSRRFALSVLFTVPWATACAVADTSLRFDGMEHPVSLSSHLPPEAAALATIPLGTFRQELRTFAFVYGYLPMERAVQLAPVIDREIRRLGGTAAINVSVEVHHCVLNYVVPLNVLPIWPTCARVELRGEVLGEASSSRAGRGPSG